jgi:hypothetical protein
MSSKQSRAPKPVRALSPTAVALLLLIGAIALSLGFAWFIMWLTTCEACKKGGKH